MNKTECANCGKNLTQKNGQWLAGRPQSTLCAFSNTQQKWILHTPSRDHLLGQLALSTELCTFSECDKEPFAKGLCSGHYSQQRRGLELRPLRGRKGCTNRKSKDVSWAEHFDSQLEKDWETRCHNWKGAVNGGYGRLRENGENWYAHRFAWALAGNELPEFNPTNPDAMELSHLCHNPLCCNVDHMVLETHAENLARIVREDPLESHPNAFSDHIEPLSLTSA